MKKILLLATVASTINQFCIRDIYLLQKQGYQVEIACSFGEGNCISKQILTEFKKNMERQKIKCHPIDFSRKSFGIRQHWKAYQQLLKIMTDNSYEFIHCHTPIAAAIGRIASHQTKTKCIYTAHGFHFYKHGPIQNWFIFYPIERFLARFTDILITINQEDYRRAKTFHTKRVEYLPGIGVDTKKFITDKSCKNNKRKILGISESSFVVLSVGEINHNKNHEVIMRAISKLKNKNIIYLICGIGEKKAYLKELSYQLGISQQVIFAGYCKEINEYYQIADCFAFPSYREGLGMAALEAMCNKLPILTSNIHGIVDYSMNRVTGFSYSPNDLNGFANGIAYLYSHPKERHEMGTACQWIAKYFDSNFSKEKMEAIYKSADKGELKK